uniref:Uncharacterized protein n=1 Tax=Cannabis sativa TaxID=3483 RepID=A0A803QZN3_CANSA
MVELRRFPSDSEPFSSSFSSAYRPPLLGFPPWIPRKEKNFGPKDLEIGKKNLQGRCHGRHC